MEIVDVLNLIVNQMHQSSLKGYLIEGRYSDRLIDGIVPSDIKDLLLGIAKGIQKPGLLDYITSCVDDIVLNLDTYAKYLSRAYSLETRDYNKLLKVLSSNTIIFRDILKTIFESGGINRTIYEVIDIGAGHDGYVPILKHIFPNLQTYYLVDKGSPEILLSYEDYGDSIDVKVHNGTDAFMFIDQVLSKNNPTDAFPRNTIIFISEFLHCKKDNIRILKTLKGSGYGVLINELVYDPYIDLRLTLSGGRIIQPKECADILIGKKVKCDAIMYSTMFNYYLMRFKGV